MRKMCTVSLSSTMRWSNLEIGMLKSTKKAELSSRRLEPSSSGWVALTSNSSRDR